MIIFKLLCFSLPKKGAGADPKTLAPALAQILNQLRLQAENLGSGSATLDLTVKVIMNICPSE